MSNPDHSSVNPFDKGERRQHMQAVFSHLGLLFRGTGDGRTNVQASPLLLYFYKCLFRVPVCETSETPVFDFVITSPISQ
jgi:hypothetical protein